MHGQRFQRYGGCVVFFPGVKLHAKTSVQLGPQAIVGNRFAVELFVPDFVAF